MRLFLAGPVLEEMASLKLRLATSQGWTGPRSYSPDTPMRRADAYVEGGPGYESIVSRFGGIGRFAACGSLELVKRVSRTTLFSSKQA
jgi:hypothetical protein